MNREVYDIAKETRLEFAQGLVPDDLLAELYTAYEPVDDIGSFLRCAAAMFPIANCGLTSVYLQHRLQAGELVHGTYAGQGHTFLKLGGMAVVDITADQFGGPAVYAGELTMPWKLPT